MTKKVRHFVGSSLVISERKKMERIDFRQNRAEESNRLKSAFANMDYEIRTRSMQL